MKPFVEAVLSTDWTPAAFRRLCVETIELDMLVLKLSQPPLGGCVLKLGVIA